MDDAVDALDFKVIGAGFGRTGTLSLKIALETLGFGPCHHMVEVMSHPEQIGQWAKASRGEAVNWHEVLSGYRSGVDWPISSYYRELADVFPEAKVLLSVRDPGAWFRSTQNTIFSEDFQERLANELDGQDGRDFLDKIRVQTFGGKSNEEAHAIEVFNRHTEEVRRTIPAGRLLVYELGSGWEPICRFLNVPIPDEPYPSTNSTDDFRAMRQISD